ncbi:MAG: peptidoglycan editing factor PgeF [Rhodospirillales bacterium]|nr:peptidoglycan editing factor PgeF [Rhodospirillales bacterium]
MITAQSLSGYARLRHGFFTREGGVSGGVYDSLNCGPGSDDDPAHVAANRERALNDLGGAGGSLVTAHQVHSADVVVVDAPWTLADAPPRADGLATARPGIALGVLTADCVPVLFADPGAGVIGAAHAGWKGALGGILEATVESMIGLGAEASAIAAAVGPCIGFESYEVGPEFHAAFLADSETNGVFFTAAKREGHFQFDLAGYVFYRLSKMGLGLAESVPGDTYVDEARFFSYRRACHRGEADYGRFLSAIMLHG